MGHMNRSVALIPAMLLSACASAWQPSSSSDVLNALLGLGYSDKEARIAAAKIPADMAVSDGIRAALKALAKS